jgi:phosphatidylethanolamine/phosphatidyl-N-methylethanolamine N-methyltransferase
MASWAGMKFLRSFLKSPQSVGGIFPSSQVLARAIAAIVSRELAQSDPASIIEVGPGTGALTEALLPLKRPLVLLERNADFARILSQRFAPQALVRCEDFLTSSIFSTGTRGAVLVSSLPIRSLPMSELYRARFQELLLGGNISRLVQYSYGIRDPLLMSADEIVARRERVVLWNFPPASIWSYQRRTGGELIPKDPLGRPVRRFFAKLH